MFSALSHCCAPSQAYSAQNDQLCTTCCANITGIVLDLIVGGTVIALGCKLNLAHRVKLAMIIPGSLYITLGILFGTGYSCYKQE